MIRRSGILAALLGLAITLVAGCGGGGGSSTATTTSTSRPSTTTAAPTGPAVVHLGLVGGTGLTGTLTPDIVHCALPTLQGPELLVIGHPTDTNLSVRVMLLAGSVTVGVDTGSGAQYRERDFTGTGMTGFDPARGATIDSPLTAVPPAAGTAVANLPALASITGSIDCAGQTAGTSTLAITGDTEEGAVSGQISPVNVSCKQGVGALIIGIVHVGSGTQLIDMSVRGNLFSFFVQAQAAHQYSAAAGSASTTATGGHVDGDAVEMVAAGATPHKLHVVGDVTCGQNPTG
jgi:hypothetical protein